MHSTEQLLLGMVAAVSLVSCGPVDQVAVSDAAREDVIGSAEVVHEIESGTNGATSLEVRYLVLDLGEEDAIAAADVEAERLEEAGWEIGTGQPPARHTGSSQQVNASVAVYTLDEFLEDDSSDEQINSELREAVPSPGGLIVVAVEPRTYE